MKKKLLLLLFPLTIGLVSCGKDVDPSVKKVDLARLLDESEVSRVYRLAKDKFSKNLSGMELNYAMIEDDLINQRTEMSASGSLKIKGDEYSESKAELVNKVKNNFYTYTSKTIMENKVAKFGDYYINFMESYTDGQKNMKNQEFNYNEAGEQKIVDVSTTFPISISTLNSTTVGVDKGNVVYAVYSNEAITTQEGKDKDGKDATFIDKTTHEIYVKLGKLDDPKVEAYKTVELHEANYDKELKVYKNYQTVSSDVMSYKFEYKNRGKNDGRDKFINSLPEKYINAASANLNLYQKEEGDKYSLYDSQQLDLSAFKGEYSDGLFTFKENDVAFTKNYAYDFTASYVELTIDKANQKISALNKQAELDLIYESEDMEGFTATVNSKSTKLLRLKEGTSSASHVVHFLFDPSNSKMTIYIR